MSKCYIYLIILIFIFLILGACQFVTSYQLARDFISELVPNVQEHKNENAETRNTDHTAAVRYDEIDSDE